MKSLFLIGCYFLVLSTSMGCNGPTLTATDADQIDTSQDPEQLAVTSVEPAVVTLAGGSLTITPVATYRVSGWSSAGRPMMMGGNQNSRPLISPWPGGNWPNLNMTNM